MAQCPLINFLIQFIPTIWYGPRREKAVFVVQRVLHFSHLLSLPLAKDPIRESLGNVGCMR